MSRLWLRTLEGRPVFVLGGVSLCNSLCEADAPGAEIPLRFALPPLATRDVNCQAGKRVVKASAGRPKS